MIVVNQKNSSSMKKKIVFLSSLIPETLKTEVKQKMKKGMPDAASALQWHLIEGLYYNYQSSISLINVLPISSYPQNYEDVSVRKESFSTDYSPVNINVGFVNLKGLRRYSIERCVYKELCSAFSEDNEGILFVYTLSASFLKAIRKFKRKKPQVHVCAIVADLPSMNDMAENVGIINKMANDILAKKAYKNLSIINSFV